MSKHNALGLALYNGVLNHIWIRSKSVQIYIYKDWNQIVLNDWIDSCGKSRC